MKTPWKKWNSFGALLTAAFLLCGAAVHFFWPPQSAPQTNPFPRTIRITSGNTVRTLDPALADDLPSRNMAGAIYDTLLQYNFSDRPYRLEPSMLTAMPRYDEHSGSYFFELRDDLYFIHDACFQAQGNSLESRKVTSKDVIFSFLRIADMRLHSPVFWMFRGKVRGIDEFAAATEQAAPQDYAMYEKGIAGFEILDDRHFAIHLNQPDPRFLYNLAIPYTGILARQAVNYYGNSAMADHPVSSGPFRVLRFQRDYQLILERNPDFREEFYPQAENPEDRTRALPLADRIEVLCVKQTLTAWLLFLQGELDATALNKDNSDLLVGGTTLSPALRKRQVNLLCNPEFEIQYVGFNLSHPLFAHNPKLRQAISLAYNIPSRIEHANYLMLPIAGPIPPGVPGYDDTLENPYNHFNPTLAKRLLAEAGYPDGIDPATGQPLQITFDQSGNTATHRQYGEMTARDLKEIGIEVTVVLNNAPRFYQKLRQGQLQLFRLSWIGDYPDAENFLQLFYSKNHGGSNRTFFQDADYDKMFEEILPMADSPERTRRYQEMARYLVEQTPWIFESQPVGYQLKHHWLQNYIAHDFGFNRWKYWSVDPQERERSKRNFTPLSFQELREENTTSQTGN